MKNILVLIDLDKEAVNISKSALNIARQLHANLVLSCLHHSASLIVAFHDQEGILPDEKHFTSTEDLADFLKSEALSDNEFNQSIVCIDLVDNGPQTIKKFVAKNNIWMIIKEMPEFSDLNIEDSESICNIVKCINCPHLFIPHHSNLTLIDKIAYLTDLRYCDTGVVRFLKAFNAFVFITHISANGLPDIAENYAQTIMTEEIAIKTRYNKLFLRIIKRNDKSGELEKVIAGNAIQMCAVVNKKQQLLEELFSVGTNKIKNICQIPLLIIPFFDWFIS